MKAIVNTAPDRLELQERLLPEPGPSEVRIRTLACAICATDLEMIGGCSRSTFPQLLGHEWCGIVDAVGPEADRTLAGRTVVGDNILTDGGEVGFEHPGGYAEQFITLAANVIPLPAGLAPHAAALIEPLAVCLRAIARVQEMTGDILILGDGPIGLICAMLLARSEANRITLAGGRAERLRLAEASGCRKVLNYHEHPDLAAALADTPPMLVIESSGNVRALEAALQITAVGGTVLVLGDYKKSCAAFAWNMLLHRELRLVGSNTGSGAWRKAAALAPALPLETLVTHRFPAARFDEAMAAARSREAGAVKVVMEWGDA